MTQSTTLSATDDQITLDRRNGDRRDLEAASESQESQPARRKQQRRRQIDPTTCERDYSNQEIEFMQAMDEYKRAAGRMFPTCSEVLEVIRALGYVRLDDEQRDLLESEGLQPFEPYTPDEEKASEDEEEDDELEIDS